MPVTDPSLQPTPPAARQPDLAASAQPTKLCLLLLFNHHYEANLPKLDRLYRGRFEHVRYLMPFYRGDRPDVIPVYHSSYQFQGFFMTAWQRLRAEGFTHFVICADDMVLNPRFDDKNFLAAFGVGLDSGYTKSLLSMSDQSFNWSATTMGLVAVEGKNGTNWQQELPAAEAAAANLEAKGHRLGRLGWHNLRHGIRMKGFFLLMFYLVLRVLKRRREPGTDVLGLPYPLLSGNADLMVVPTAYMDKFCFYCSVFAAMGLFVEIAAPTALVLACPRVVCECDTGGWIGRDFFLNLAGPKEYEEFCRKIDYNLDHLLARFDDRTITMHPVKLSRWHFSDAAAS